MAKYLTYVGVGVEVEADTEEQAIRLARETMFAEISTYKLTDLGVEIIEELED